MAQGHTSKVMLRIMFQSVFLQTHRHIHVFLVKRDKVHAEATQRYTCAADISDTCAQSKAGASQKLVSANRIGKVVQGSDNDTAETPPQPC